MIRDRVRLGILAVTLGAALTGFTAPAVTANTVHPHAWRVVDQTTVSGSIAGEGVATVRTPGQPLRIYYTAGATIPADLQAQAGVTSVIRTRSAAMFSILTSKPSAR
ncbi:hypothetical protein [Fodinicola feengrottensis]|uniref:hypothetical protein n=1 Tax=Fodinicola feengrottensis TaxID=435914 RepID=UPI0013D76AEF|nr:hypothetical protein [Fodinicola feengrottensis]